MTIKLRTGNAWQNVSAIKLRAGNAWQNVTKAYLRAGNAWQIFFGKDGPEPDFPLEISSNSTDYPATLTGKNYHWDTGTTLTSKFQRSSTEDGPWEDVTNFSFIANPSVGASNISTLLLLEQHFILNQSSTFFRFVVKGVNSTNNSTATESSDPIEIFVTAPIMTRGQITSTSTTISIPFTYNFALKYYIVETYGASGLVSSTRVNTPSSPVVVTGLTPNTTYDIVVFPYNFVNMVGIAMLGIGVSTVGPPGTPTVIPSSTESSWSLNITFGANTTRVVINYGTTTSYGSNATLSASGTFTPVGPFPPNTLYYYRVTPFNGTESGTAVEGSIRTKVFLTPPSPPRNVSIENVAGRNYNEGQAFISWTSPANNGGASVDYYRVQYAYDYDVSTWYTLSNDWVGTSMYAGPFSDGFTIRAKVFAHNSEGFSESAVSPPPGAYINTKAEPLVLLTATRQSSTSIRVTFTPSVLYGGSKGTGGSNVLYFLRTRSDLGFTSQQVTTSPATITGLTSGYQYEAFIRASNDQGTADSNSIFVGLINPPVNISLPTISPGSGTAGVTTFSSTTGSWSNSPTTFSYQWRYFVNDLGTYFDISGATSSTYSPPSNYVDVYGTRLLCRVTASNVGGSATSDSSNVTVNSPVTAPTGGSASISTNTGNYRVGSVITYSTSGWTGSPTSYSLRLYNGTNPVLTSDPLRASTTAASGTYTITSSDVDKFFKVFATATNSGGTSSEVSSVQVGPATAAAVIPVGSVSLSPAGTVQARNTITATSSFNNSPTSYYIEIRKATGADPSTASTLVASSTSTTVSHVITDGEAAGTPDRFRAFARATNSAGTSLTYSSNVVTSTPFVPATPFFPPFFPFFPFFPPFFPTFQAVGDPRCTNPSFPYYYYGNTCTASDDANGVGYCGDEGITNICGPGTGPECFFGCGAACCGGHV